jgi:predicted RecB family nuclease
MQLLDGQLILSPSDLTGFLACEHLTQLELKAARGEITRPNRDDPELDVLTSRGEQHELAHLEMLRASGQEVVEIECDSSTVGGLEKAAADTLVAMRAGISIIYQATLFDGRWRGHADFLERVEKPSNLGSWSYEVADTKLARTAKVPAILQLCAYSEHVERLQGVEPTEIHVELGTGARESFRLRDFLAYYRLTKARFEATVLAGAPETYPDPVEHCNVCRWLDVCNARRVADDHPCQVAGMRRDWTRKLRAGGLTTMAQLAATEPNGGVDGLQTHILDRLHNQARMQVAQRESGTISFELLPPEPGFGLAMLPEPSHGDLFFDMEGDPFAGQDGTGLEYLWGLLEPGAEEGSTWHAFWGHDVPGEKVAFEQTVDLIISRLDHDLALHVYHYADYERSRLRTLAGRYATREEEVDRLLRGGVLVDLYRAVHHGVRVSQDSYSLKKLEPLYIESRDAAIVGAGSSIVAYEKWLESHDQQLLDDIEAYNRDDCVSTWKLRGWLETRRVEAMGQFNAVIERPEPQLAEPSEQLAEAEAETAGLVTRLTAGVPDAEIERSPDQQARWLLGQLLGWHRREARSQWWEYFRRLELTPEELIDDRDSIGGLEYEGVVGEVKKSLIHRYRFPPQENKIRVGDTPDDPATGSATGTVCLIDNVAGVVDLSRGKGWDKVHPRALVKGQPYDTREQRRALARIAENVLAHGLETSGSHRAGLALLRRLTPSVIGVARDRDDGAATNRALQRPGEDQLDAAIRLGLEIRDSYLPIQGPPGSGKTWTAARMIVALVDAGKRVGITATGHKVIANVLDAICRFCEEEGRPTPRLLQRCGEDEKCPRPGVERAGDNGTVDARLAAGEVDAVAGTAWLFAREPMAGRLDVMFVDEAGQMSLADALAVSQAARNLVLLGDPQQLAQPSQGSHPPGAGVSALEHVLERHATVPLDRGLFLATTYRMHPDVCEFISEIAYEGRLRSEPGCERQKILGDGPLSGTGLRYLPVEHQGNRTWSAAEVEVVGRQFRALLSRGWINKDGIERAVTVEDVLVVAPYNTQVARLADGLPGGSRVGTVDKFQGQEAAVVFYSMASSSPEDMPRNLEFLYSLNRLNVAMSRARCMAVLVCSPALLSIRCRTLAQMQLANAMCKAAESGTARIDGGVAVR